MSVKVTQYKRPDLAARTALDETASNTIAKQQEEARARGALGRPAPRGGPPLAALVIRGKGQLRKGPECHACGNPMQVNAAYMRRMAGVDMGARHYTCEMCTPIPVDHPACSVETAQAWLDGGSGRLRIVSPPDWARLTSGDADE